MIIESITKLIVPKSIRKVLEGSQSLPNTVKLGIATGTMEGIGLFLLVPTATTIVTGEAVWGITLRWWIVLLALITVLGSYGRFRLAMNSYDMGMNFLQFIHERVGKSVAKAPLGWFTQQRASELSRCVSSEIMFTGQIAAHGVSSLMVAVFSSLALTICCWFWSWQLGLIISVAFPLFYFMAGIGTIAAKKAHEISNPADANLNERIVEFANCQPEIRSAGRSHTYEPLLQANEKWWKQHIKSLWWETIGMLITGTAAQIIVIAMVVLATILVTEGYLGFIAGMGFIVVALRLMETLSTIGEIAVSIEIRKGPMRIIDEVISKKPLSAPEYSVKLPNPGDITVDNISFGYLDGIEVLHNVSLHALPNTVTALVGPSGCGKTTLSMLISRFYDVNKGRITVGGVDVREQPVEQLMSQISMVFQDVYLFDDTLLANIAIGNEKATKEEIYAAGEKAGVGEIVRRLPDGWNTRVGEAGKKLSGGERQRVSIARAIIKKAPILLIDEATSSLDPENEANILAAVEEIRKNSTVVVIAHKINTIATADQICVFTDDGKIDDIGKHEELINRCAKYKLFWQARNKAQGWTLV